MAIDLTEHIRSIPLLRPLIFYIIGIQFYNLHISDRIFAVLALVFTLIFFLQFLFVKGVRIFNFTACLIVMFSYLILGFGVQFSRQVPELEEIPESVLIAEVCDYPVEKEQSWLLEVRIISINDSAINNSKRLNANLYFSKEDSIINNNALLEPGRILLCKTSLRLPKNNRNPEEFDYAAYLKRRNIYYTGFVTSGQCLITNKRIESLKSKALRCRRQIEKKIEVSAHCSNQDALSVLIAIGLGDKVSLADEIKKDFAKAGAIHVMAVSGLHVGLIWMFLGFVCAFMKRNRFLLFIRFLIITILIWIYAFLTGLSPSVTRAAIMFSIVGLGNFLSRNTSSINNVIVSAFIQLIIDPQVLYNLGFQFSYLAVISILFFQKPIRKVFPDGNRLLSYLLDLISVSISAQILTFPLSFYYFHTFPAYFLITNILIIPLVTLIMILFLMSVLFIYSQVVFSFIIGKCLIVTGLMVKATALISHLPGSMIENIYINIFQVFILLSMAFLILLFREYKKLWMIKFICLSLGIFLSSGIINFIRRNDAYIAVLNTKAFLAVDIYSGRNHYLLTDNENFKNEQYQYFLKFWLKNCHEMPEMIGFNDVSDLDMFKLPGEGNVIIHFGGQRIAILSDYKNLNKYSFERSIETNLIILNSFDLWNYDIISSSVQSNNIVLSSVINDHCSKYLQKGNGTEIIYQVSNFGAYIYPLAKNEIKNDFSLWLFDR